MTQMSKEGTTYEIVVAVKRKGFRARTYDTTLKMDYNDKNFQECEGLIRDTLVDIGNRFITEEWYS